MQLVIACPFVILSKQPKNFEQIWEKQTLSKQWCFDNVTKLNARSIKLIYDAESVDCSSFLNLIWIFNKIFDV